MLGFFFAKTKFFCNLHDFVGLLVLLANSNFTLRFTSLSVFSSDDFNLICFFFRQAVYFEFLFLSPNFCTTFKLLFVELVIILGIDGASIFSPLCL